MTYNSAKRHTFYLFLYLIMAALYGYAFVDMQTSSVTGNAGSDRGMTHIFLFVLIGLHILYFLYHIVINRKLYSSGIMLTVFLLTSWIFFVDIIRNVHYWTMLTHCAFSILWFLAYWFFNTYYLLKPECERTLKTLLFLLMTIYAVSIVYYMGEMYASRGRLVVSNLSYNVLVILPWFFLGKTKNKEILLIIITAIFMAISMKRGAIIAYVIMVAFYMFARGRENNQTAKYLGRFILSLIAFVIVFLVVDHYLNGQLLYRFTSDQMQDGSGREWLYPYIISLIKQRNIADFMIGAGSGSSVLNWGTGAHNEWLEFTFSFGFIGFILYLILIIEILKMVISFRRVKSEAYVPSMMSFIYILVVGMVGGIYFMQSSYYVFALFGYLKGYQQLEPIKEEVL